MSKYNWGIVGTGSIAKKFAEDLRRTTQAASYSVFSRTHKKAKIFAERYNFKYPFEDIDSFLNDPGLDIVYIATPNHLHCEQAIQSLKAGKHVLVEKPLALNAREGQKILKTARENNRFCMEAMWVRFMPVYQQIKEILARKELGEIKFFSAEFGIPMGYDPKQFRFSLEKGGGSLLDLGVYPISLSLMLLGKPEQVKGECQKAENGVDVLNRISLFYKNGSIADLKSSFNCQLSNSIWIGGDKGAISIPGPIYRPDQYRLSKYNSGLNPTNQDAGIKERIKKIPVISNILRGLNKIVLNPLKELKQINKFNLDGNGYQYEIEEVMNVLNEDRIESQIMSLQESIAVLEITDQLRREWGIIFPGIDN